MKRIRNITIASKLRIYFIGFAVVMLGVVWLFQGLFLDSFYRYTKTSKITKLAHKIEKTYHTGSLYDFTQDALNTESHVQIINRNGIILVDTVGIPTPKVQLQNALVYQAIFNSLRPGQGNVIDVNAIDNASFVPTSRLSYALKLDENVLLFIQTEMVPVSATVETIQFQLVVVSLFIIAVALFLTRKLSRNISRPMIDISSGAKLLSQGDYNVEIVGQGYKEIESLSATLNTMRQDLQRVETMRNELLANVSHDLRTPLTMVQGYLELMKDFPNERNEENLDLVILESQRLKEMIQNLLDLSRIQTGLESLKLETFESKHWFEENERRYKDYAKDRTLHFEADEGRVIGDKALLQQALDNLIQNALKHTDGEVIVSGEHLEGSYVVSVKDYGKGILESQRESIWERYYTTDNNHTRDDNSYGLGLSIVKRIFESHNIEYGYRIHDKGGSVFYFRLNLHEEII